MKAQKCRVCVSPPARQLEFSRFCNKCTLSHVPLFCPRAFKKTIQRPPPPSWESLCNTLCWRFWSSSERRMMLLSIPRIRGSISEMSTPPWFDFRSYKQATRSEFSRSREKKPPHLPPHSAKPQCKWNLLLFPPQPFFFFSSMQVDPATHE